MRGACCSHDGAERPQTPPTKLLDCRGLAFAGVQGQSPWPSFVAYERPTSGFFRRLLERFHADRKRSSFVLRASSGPSRRRDGNPVTRSWNRKRFQSGAISSSSLLKKEGQGPALDPLGPKGPRPHPLSDWIAKALPLLGSKGKAPGLFRALRTTDFSVFPQTARAG